MQKRTFKHLNQAKRDRIQALKKSGHNQREIADVIGVSAGTISREIQKRKRKNGSYQSDTAQLKAQIKRSRSKYQGMKIEKYPDLRKYIIKELKTPRSPDEIAGRMKAKSMIPRVGKDAIYKWLYSSRGQRYCRYLCTKRYTKKKQREDKSKRHLIPNMARIGELTPKSIKTYGHCEGDTFVSPRKAKTTAGAALVVETHSKLLAGRKISSLKPEQMKQAMLDMQNDMAMKTIVFDRGIENQYHEQFGVDSYFCDPQAPWQKPLVEGSIGLLRRWFWPKGTNLENVSEEELQKNIDIINSKYRKSLNYMSAKEVAIKNGILKS